METASKTVLTTDSSGRFIVGRDSVPMQLWQHVDSDGKLHYSLAPVTEETRFEEKIAIKSMKTEETAGKPSCVDSLLHLCGVAIESYACERCGMKFPLENMLNRHRMSHNMSSWLKRRHTSVRRRTRANPKRQRKQPHDRKRTLKHGYRCSLCEFGCNRRITLAMHIRNKHKLLDGLGKFECGICDHSCDTRTDLNKHMREHRNPDTMYFVCAKCKFECKRSSTLVSHAAQHHQKTGKERTKKCKVKRDHESKKNDVCSGKKSENLPDSIDIERKSPDRVTSRGGKKGGKKVTEERCNICDFKCSAKSTMYSHKRQHKVENVSEVYACNECGFKTSKKSSLYSHIKRKHKLSRACTGNEQPKLFYCSQCDYKNKNKYELKVHVARKHTDDFKFSCETCGKKFKVKGDLTNHIRFSHREQPVICDVCGKTCLNSNSLYVHQKFAHYKAKYECQVCKRRMVSQENLNEHMLRQHERRENVVCEECGKTFSRNSRLKVHMRIHTGDKPYTCTICNKSFARRTALKQHLLIHTGIRPYVCDICGKAFTQKPGLISHRKSHPGSHPPLPRVLIDHILNDVMNN